MTSALPLTGGDFTVFYQAIHRHEPFPWQRDLASQVLSGGRWPAVVDVPTGLGKTSMLDIAIFLTAATAGVEGPGRAGRRRILFVVDRRVVVDEAYEHAQTIAAALDDAERTGGEGVVARVAAGLRALGGDPGGAVLSVTRMRGGTTWASAWVDRPDRTAVVVGTVDQVGSRFLFRGYGVGNRRKPIDAALVGTDALLLVDEAHLADAFLTTLSSAGDRDRVPVAVPGLSVVQLSATARDADRAGPDPSEGLPFDLDAHLQVQEARQRLQAAKRLSLLEVTPKEVTGALAKTALALTGAGDDSLRPVVLVVCNTIGRAREVFTTIGKAVTGKTGQTSAEVDLLIGRSRSIDRAALDARVRARYGIGMPRTDRPAILVATQTVEVGINLDVDALVTESASWDALVQRLGRLNRIGRLGERLPSHAAATAVVVHDGQADGPIYGLARDATWELLREQSTPEAAVEDAVRGVNAIDASPQACRGLSDDFPPRTRMRAAEPPILTRPILDQWTHTGPVPTLDPPIDAYLHGFAAGSPSVSLAWRDGLLVSPDPGDLHEEPHEAGAAAVNALLGALPVRAGEKVEVPLFAVRRWMSGQRAVPISDLDDAADGEGLAREERRPFEVLARREHPTLGERWDWITAINLRPGDQIVIPIHRGGLDPFGWNPDSTTAVTDMSEAAALDARHLLLRLDGQLGRRLGLDNDDDDLASTVALAVRRLRRLLRTVDEDDDPTTGPSDDDPRAQLPETVEAAVAQLVTTLVTALGDGAPALAGGAANEIGLADRRENLVRFLERAQRSDTPRIEAFPVWESPEDLLTRSDNARAKPLVSLLSWRPARGDTFDATSALDVQNSGLELEDDDPLASSLGCHSSQVTLERHLTNVRARARRIAENLRLPDELVEVISDAAGWHDVGKVEERFQISLHEGDAIEAAIAPEPLAKSGMDPDDQAAWRLAHRRSKLPPGARHEAWSASLVAHYLRERPQPYPHDADLLVHLIASHHGHARPLLPLVVDDDPRPVTRVFDDVKATAWSGDTVDLAHPGRFERLNARYGRWGLALLETVVRCADTTVSAEGS